MWCQIFRAILSSRSPPKVDEIPSAFGSSLESRSRNHTAVEMTMLCETATDLCCPAWETHFTS